MSEATIRIEASVPGGPKAGLVGALAGGQEDGGAQAIEIDLRGANPDTIAENVARAAEAYRTAFFGERSVEGLVDAEVFETDEVSQPGTIPFPEAGDIPSREQRAANRAEAQEVIVSAINTASADDAAPITAARIIQELSERGIL